jgi:hypothetical protein
MAFLGTPYGEAFNWDQLVLPEHEEREWYCVVFRSKRKAGSDGDRSSNPLHRTNPSLPFIQHCTTRIERPTRKPFTTEGCVIPRVSSSETGNDEMTQLLLYWYGIPNQSTGMNLATCIWQSRKHATAANSGPHHVRAMKLTAASYEVYDLERHVLRKVAGSTGVTVEPFTGGDVGW